MRVVSALSPSMQVRGRRSSIFLLVHAGRKMNRHRLVVRRKRINHRLQGLPWCHLNQHHLFLLFCRVDGRAVPRHCLMLARQLLIQLGGRPCEVRFGHNAPLRRTGGRASASSSSGSVPPAAVPRTRSRAFRCRQHFPAQLHPFDAPPFRTVPPASARSPPSAHPSRASPFFIAQNRIFSPVSAASHETPKSTYFPYQRPPQRRRLWTPAGTLSLHPFARLS